MRKRFISLAAIFYSLFGLTVLILINCGGGGGGGGEISSTTTTTETTVQSSSTTSTTTTIPPSSDVLIGNFRFVYRIISIWTDRITLNTKSSQKTSEGTDFYTGYNASYPSSVMAGGAWSPSLSKYLIVTVRTYSSFVDGYVFSINTDNTLSGCYMLSSNSGSTWSNCYSFIIPDSHKTPLGSWDTSLESQHAPIDFDEAFGQKIAEDLQVKTHRSESTGAADGNLISKVNELKAIIENNRY